MPVVLPPNLAVDGFADRKVPSVEPTRFKGYGQFEPFGPNSAQIEAGKPGNLTKLLSGMDQGIVGPLVSRSRFGRRFGSQLGRATSADAGGEKSPYFSSNDSTKTSTCTWRS
jgi:hypothetical protein